MRPAITLLITLSVIATMIALMGVMFKYLDATRLKAEVKASMIQANLLSADIGQLLKRTLGKSPSTKTMKTLFETPLGLAAESGEFSMGITCNPLANRINIAWLGFGENSRKEKEFLLADSLFETLVDEVNLRDSALLKEKIITSIKEKNNRIFGKSSRLFKKKGIITFKMFQEILDEYRYEKDDNRVYSVAWKKYFSFGTNTKKIDGDFATVELLAFLYEVDVNVVKENYELGELDAFLSEIGETQGRYKWLFSEKTLPIARCEVGYSFRKGSYGFVFNYLDRRVEGFEFFGN